MPSLKKNVGALYAYQVLNYVIPLIALPWLTRVLGPAVYGSIIFSLSLCTYLSLVVDFGFGYSGTRRIAATQDDLPGLGLLFGSVSVVRLGLLVASALVYFAVVICVPSVRVDWKLFSTGFIFVVGTALQSWWLFQGLELYKEGILCLMVMRVISLLGIFLLVRRPEDSIWAIFLMAFAPFGAAFMMIPMLLRRLPVWCWSIDFRFARMLAAESFSAFMSSAAASLYLNAVTAVLGFTSTREEVGLYGIASKVITVLTGIWVPLSQAVYPRISGLMVAGNHAAVKLLRRRTALVMGGAGLAGSVVVWLAGGPIVKVLFGYKYISAIPIIRILAWVPFVMACSNYLGILKLFAAGNFSGPAIWQGGVSLVSMVWLIPLVVLYGATGAAWSVLASEFAVAAGYFVLSRRQR